MIYFADKGGNKFNLFPITTSITIPSSVRWFNFMGQAISFTNWTDGTKPVFIIEGDSSDPPLVIERMSYHDQQNVENNPIWLHRGSRTVVFKDCKGRYLAEEGAGDVFFEDYVSQRVDFSKNQKVWARQFNLEDAKNTAEPLVTNNGANLWILGYKTEGAKTILKTINRGKTEMFGGNFLPLQGASTNGIPLFIVEDASFSAVGYQAFYTWNIHVRETRNGITKELLKNGKVNMAIFTGFSNELTIPQKNVIGESGNIYTDKGDTWYTIKFKNRYNNPVLVMGPFSFNGSQPVTVRTRNVNSEGFDYKLDEWDYLDGAHVKEKISYLVIEDGEHILEKGQSIKAGFASEGITPEWVEYNFLNSFKTSPLVFTQIASYNDAKAVVNRHRNIDKHSFEVKLQEEKANNNNHQSEDLHWIAIEPGYEYSSFEIYNTPNEVTSNWYLLDFEQSYNNTAFLGSIQSYNGQDPSGLRYKDRDDKSIQLFVEEENSTNDGISHTKENIGYAVFESSKNIYGYSDIDNQSLRNNNGLNESNKNLNNEYSSIQVKIHPNPLNQETLNIDFLNTKYDFISISVFDIRGRKTLFENFRNIDRTISLNVSKLPSGTFFVKINTNKENITKRLIIE